MDYRSEIIKWGKYWASPSEWKPTEEDLVNFFKDAGAEAWPSIQEAREALKNRVTGVKVKGQVKQWCGVFACYILRLAGLTTVRWTLYGGKMKNIPLVWGSSGMQPGDVAMIQSANRDRCQLFEKYDAHGGGQHQWSIH